MKNVNKEIINKHITVFGLIALTFAFVFALSAHALVASGPSLNASLLYYQPVPATPGSLLDVYVQINNNGDAANKVTVNFVDNGPFTLDNEADRIKLFDSIPGQQNQLIKYKVRVSKDALPGTNNIKLEYSIGGANTQSTLLPIDIYSNTLSLTIDSITTMPNTFVPGGVGNFTVNIRNSAGVKVSSGTINLDLSGLDIVPVQATNQQRFTDLEANSLASFTFMLSPSPSLSPGIYKIPIVLNFTDQQGKAYQLSQVVGLRVGAEPDLSVTIDDSKLTKETNPGDVIITVTNKGLGGVKFVDLQLGNSDSYDITSGSPERYVGSIDSDDYKTARVTVQAKKDTVTIPVTVTYLDALNTPYSKQVMLSLPVHSTKSGPSGLMILIVLVIVAAAAYFFFKRRKEK